MTGAWLAGAREAAGVREQTIARAAGAPVSQVRAWESGEAEPEGSAAEAYLRVIAGLHEALAPEGDAS